VSDRRGLHGALQAHLWERQELSQAGRWKHFGLVFTTDIGTPISPRNLLRHFKLNSKEAGLPDIRFHDLRHSTITLTLNTYSHITNPLGRAAADTMDDVVGRK
jgi:integrase